jgi:hypothetical protein
MSQFKATWLRAKAAEAKSRIPSGSAIKRSQLDFERVPSNESETGSLEWVVFRKQLNQYCPAVELARFDDLHLAQQYMWTYPVK